MAIQLRLHSGETETCELANPSVLRTFTNIYQVTLAVSNDDERAVQPFDRSSGILTASCGWDSGKSLLL